MNVEKPFWTADVLCPGFHINRVTHYKLRGINLYVNLEDTLDLNYNYKLLEIQNVLKPFVTN